MEFDQPRETVRLRNENNELLARLSTMEENWNREKALSAQFQQERGGLAEDLQRALRREDEITQELAKALTERDDLKKLETYYFEKEDELRSQLEAAIKDSDKLFDENKELKRKVEALDKARVQEAEWKERACYRENILYDRLKNMGYDDLNDYISARESEGIIYARPTLVEVMSQNHELKKKLDAALASGDSDVNELIEIADSRDAAINGLTETVNKQAAEIEELEALIKAKELELEGVERRASEFVPDGFFSAKVKANERKELVDEANKWKGMFEARERRLTLLEQANETASKKLEQARLKIKDANLKLSQAHAQILGQQLAQERAQKEANREEIPHETTLVLDRARKLICGERAAEYGEPDLSFGCIAMAWEAYRQAMGDRIFDGRDVAWMMTQFKSIRDAIKRKPDNLYDGAGYIQCGGWVTDLAEKPEEEPEGLGDECDECAGTGETYEDEECEVCEGTGVVYE